jgi:hypothetical protein
LLVVLGLLAMCCPVTADANGRSIGVRATDVSVDAAFEDRSGAKHVWSRATIGFEDRSEASLHTRLGEATSKVPLAKLAQVVFIDTDATGDGYAKARMRFADGGEETLYVKVQERGKPVKLMGYARGGASEIALLRCKHITFSYSTEEPGQQGPAPSTPKK